MSYAIYAIFVFVSCVVVRCSTPCECPKSAEQWAMAICDKEASHRYNSDITDGLEWPFPHNNSNAEGECVSTVLPICDVDGSNVPVTVSSSDLHPHTFTNSSDVYNILLKEYTAALLNVDLGPESCSHPKEEQYQQVMQKDTVDGDMIVVNLHEDVLERARIILTLWCSSRDIVSPTLREESSWLSSVLHGFNQGVLFSNATSCIVGGKINVSARTGPEYGLLTCDSGKTYSYTSSRWLEKSCVVGHGHINKKECPHWPGSTKEEPTLTEDTFLCGSEETYSGVLRMDSDSATRDAWTQLAAQYVSGILNRQKGVCVTETVIQTLQSAKTLLDDECPCSDVELLGQVGCNHTIPSGSQVEQYTSILEDYNSGLFSFGRDHHGPTDTSAIQLDVRNADNSECCSGGGGSLCTRDYAYYMSHNCHVAHGNQRNRIAWPSDIDSDCSTFPNFEDVSDFFCQYSLDTLHDLVSAYNPSTPIKDSDAWTLLAQAVTVTELNIRSGTCYKDIVTRYRDSSQPWALWSFERVMNHSKSLLSENCNVRGSVYYDTALGQQMNVLRVVLNDYIRGNYGPGACYPNDMSSSCNNVALHISQKVSDQEEEQHQHVTVNAGYSSAMCPVNNQESCCTRTANYWANNHVDAPPPRNVPWIKITDAVTCDDVNGFCINQAPSRQTGSAELDYNLTAIAQILRIDPINVAPTYPFGASSTQEKASFCSNLNGTISSTNRVSSTEMLSLLVKQQQGSFEVGSESVLSVPQKKWTRLANAFTTMLLNVVYNAKYSCHRSIDQLLKQVVHLEGHMGQSSTNATHFLKNTPYLQQCLFDACLLNPEDDMPSLPGTHIQGGNLCQVGYYPVVNALEAFSNGNTPTQFNADHSLHPLHHCYVYEPATKCDTGSTLRGPCKCVKTGKYYETHYQGHEDPAFDVPWPVVHTSTYSTVTNNMEGMFPINAIPISQRPNSGRKDLNIRTEDFEALICPASSLQTPTETWFDIMMKPASEELSDAYVASMKQIVTAWLNVFAGGCMPEDVYKTLEEGTQVIYWLVNPQTEMQIQDKICVSSSLGTRLSISPSSNTGKRLMSISRVLKSFNQGYHGSELCVDLCSGEDAPNCGSHGACVSETGTCACDVGYTGSRCQYSECNGNGWFQDDECICKLGWGGPECEECGTPKTFPAEQFVCMPCDASVCGVDGVYLLDHASATLVSQWVQGNNLLPGYSTLPPPVLPGQAGLDCACNRQSMFVGQGRMVKDKNTFVTNAEYIHSLKNQANSIRKFTFNNNRAAKYGQEETMPRPSRAERIIVEFEEYRLTKKNKQALLSKKQGEVARHVMSSRKQEPSDPHQKRQAMYPFSSKTSVYSHSNNFLQDRSIGGNFERDLCGTPSEQAVIEDFLLLCLEQQLTVQTQMEESNGMCLFSLDQCEEACESSEANVAFIESANITTKSVEEDPNEVSIATLVIAGLILLFLLFFGVLFCCVVLGTGTMSLRTNMASNNSQDKMRQMATTDFSEMEPLETSFTSSNISRRTGSIMNPKSMRKSAQNPSRRTRHV